MFNVYRADTLLVLFGVGCRIECLSSGVVVSADTMQVDLYMYILVALSGMNVQHSTISRDTNLKLWCKMGVVYRRL